MLDVSMFPAMAAGFVSVFGRISRGAGDTLYLPEGMVNIGGNNKGFLLSAQTDWDPVQAGNHDGTIDSLEVGDDIYIYVVQDLGGYAHVLASKNSTTPNGFTALESRKFGGFHFGRIRPVAERYSKDYVPTAGIVPNSCWDLWHRPLCDPSGMVECVPGRLWVDIYLSSEGPGIWPLIVPESRFGVAPLSGIEGHSRYLDLPIIAANAGKRLPFLHEYYVYAEGSPEGNDGDNDTAWSATNNSGRADTGYVAKAVSCKNVVDAVGNLWEPCLDLYDVGSMSDSDYNWDRAILQNGQDAAEFRGELYHRRWRCWLAGGRFDNGRRCGSCTANSYYTPGGVGVQAGLRCVCDALRHDS